MLCDCALHEIIYPTRAEEASRMRRSGHAFTVKVSSGLLTTMCHEASWVRRLARRVICLVMIEQLLRGFRGRDVAAAVRWASLRSAPTYLPTLRLLVNHFYAGSVFDLG